MTDPHTFLVLEGLLHESGAFEALRMTEDAWAEPDARSDDPDGHVELALLDEDGAVTARVRQRAYFPSGCRAGAVRPGRGLLRAAVALHDKARRLEVHVSGRRVFSAPIAPERPHAKVSVEHQDKTTLHLRVDAEDAEVRIVGQLADRRRIGVDAQIQKGIWVVNLLSLDGLGEAAILVEATRAGRTTRVIAAEVHLPGTTVHGTILEPLPDAQWPWGRRGSFIGTLSDSNGRRVEWNPKRMSWQVDGQTLGNEALAAWQPTKAGRHTVQLAYLREKGELQVLDECTITVEEQTPEQSEWRAAMDRRSKA